MLRTGIRTTGTLTKSEIAMKRIGSSLCTFVLALLLGVWSCGSDDDSPTEPAVLALNTETRQDTLVWILDEGEIHAIVSWRFTGSMGGDTGTALLIQGGYSVTLENHTASTVQLLPGRLVFEDANGIPIASYLDPVGALENEPFRVPPDSSLSLSDTFEIEVSDMGQSRLIEGIDMEIGARAVSVPTGGGAEITETNVAVVQGAVQTTIGTVIAKGPGTHNGAVSGKVKITQSIGKVAQLSVKYKLDFDNYSDDGVIWLDGTVDYNLSGTNFSYAIDIEISGAYSGEVEGEISVSGGAYSGYWNVNGTRVDF